LKAKHVASFSLFIIRPYSNSHTVLSLAAAKPARLILLGRSLAKIQPVIDSIATVSPNTVVNYIPVDLSSFPSVQNAAAKIKELTPQIDVLINNAGIMALQEYTTNQDGIELQFTTNHLGHFLLSKYLLPLIQAAGPGSRIVNISSAGHALGNIRFDDINFGSGKVYDEWLAYARGKCANALFTLSLAHKSKLKGIQSQVFSLHPGMIMETNLAANLVNPDWPMVLGLFEKAGRAAPGVETLDEGTATILAAAIDPSLTGESGSYLDDCKKSDASAFASDEGNAEKLWKLSEELVGEKFEI
jgi:NAD(P)-dependent dehydrogenase (short-subunit alcohol dehydrogenase family)